MHDFADNKIKLNRAIAEVEKVEQPPSEEKVQEVYESMGGKILAVEEE